MNIIQAIAAALQAPQFAEGDGFIQSESWDDNRCLRIPRHKSEPIIEIQDVTDPNCYERAPLLDVGEMTAIDYVVLGEDPTVRSED